MSEPQIIVAFSHMIGKLVADSETEAIGLRMGDMERNTE